MTGASTGRKLRGLYILNEWAFQALYGPDEQQCIADLVDIYSPLLTPEAVVKDRSVLADAEVIVSGWGGPAIDHAFLDAAPNLKALLYGAGATGGTIAPEAWQRGVKVTSAASINSIPVAEYTVAAIIFSLRNALRFMRDIRNSGAYPKQKGPVAGAYGSTVGLVSLGSIGRKVRERLWMLDVEVIAYDPFVSQQEARSEGIEMVSLETLFTRSDVVSIHTPWLPETERMVRGSHLASMKPGASLINTARGAVIAEDEMIRVLSERPDLTAVLDVTFPEPPDRESALYTLPNVFLTPHIAGSMNVECRRMGRFMVAELRRFLSGEPLKGEVRPETSQHTSHRLPVRA